MMSVLVLACVSMLPALVVADVFRLGWCATSYDDYLDPKVFTQEGMNILKDFGEAGPAKVYAWDPSKTEEDFKDMQLTLDITAKSFGLEYSVPGYLGSVTISGAATIETTSKTTFKLDIGSDSPSLANIFSFDNKGIADLYPVYISETDVILLGCNTVVLGRRLTMYVLTNQDYGALDADCAIQTIKDKTGWTVVKA